jgi:hypothetical protein
VWEIVNKRTSVLQEEGEIIGTLPRPPAVTLKALPAVQAGAGHLLGEWRANYIR